MESFVIGDVVRLKSGGPQMTVTNTGSTSVQCYWFESPQGGGFGAIKYYEFPPDSLKKVATKD